MWNFLYTKSHTIIAVSYWVFPPHWNSLQRSPRPISGFEGAAKRRCRGKREGLAERKGGVGEDVGKGRKRREGRWKGGE